MDSFIYTIQMVSTTHCSLRVASVKMALTVEQNVHLPNRGGGKEPPIV